MSSQFVTKTEAAELTQLSVRTIERLIASGQLKARKIGRAVRIPASALDHIGQPASYLDRHNITGGGDN